MGPVWVQQIFDRPRKRQIRLQNLLLLIDEFATMKDFAKHARVSANYCSQVTTEARTMGDDFAAKLEDNLRLGHGWMDVEHLDWTPETPEEQRRLARIGKMLNSLSEADQRKLIKCFLREGRRIRKEERNASVAK